MKEVLITSSVMILAVMILRFLFRTKVNRRLVYGVWLLVALRLLSTNATQAGTLWHGVFTTEFC